MKYMYPFLEFINLMLIGASNVDEVEPNNEDCLNALVSFWKIITLREKFMLCAGIIIKLNLIFVTHRCSESLNEIGKIILTSRREDLCNISLNLILKDIIFFENSNFAVLIVSKST